MMVNEVGGIFSAYSLNIVEKKMTYWTSLSQVPFLLIVAAGVVFPCQGKVYDFLKLSVPNGSICNDVVEVDELS